MGRRGRSPSPSMSSAPRRNMSSSTPARQPAPPPQRAPVPVATAPAAVGAPAAQGPGMMGQIASTAIGVGIGSAVGHTIGHMMTGGSGRTERDEAAHVNDQGNYPVQQQYAQQGYGQQSANPCELEMKQFLECAQNNSSDITLCTGFNEVLKSCKTRYGM